MSSELLLRIRLSILRAWGPCSKCWMNVSNRINLLLDLIIRKVYTRYCAQNVFFQKLGIVVILCSCFQLYYFDPLTKICFYNLFFECCPFSSQPLKELFSCQWLHLTWDSSLNCFYPCLELVETCGSTKNTLILWQPFKLIFYTCWFKWT